MFNISCLRHLRLYARNVSTDILSLRDVKKTDTEGIFYRTQIAVLNLLQRGAERPTIAFTRWSVV